MPVPDRPALGLILADAHCALLLAVTALLVGNVGQGAYSTITVAFLLAAPRLLQHHFQAADLLIVGFALFTYASTGWSTSPALSAQIGLDQVAVAFLFIAVRASVMSPRALVAGAIGYLIGCALMLRELFADSGAGVSIYLNQATRYTVDGINQNYVSYTFVGGLAVAGLLARYRPKLTLPLILTALALCSGIALTGTRGSFFGALAMTAWWFMFRGRTARVALRVLIVAMVGAAVAIATGWADGGLRILFPADRFRETGTLNGRLVVWPIARDMISAKPFRGQGAGTIVGENRFGIFAHNAVLDVGSGMGLMGICLLVLTLWKVVSLIEPVMAGVVIIAVAAPLLSGYWLQAAPLWILLALFSKSGTGWVENKVSAIGPRRRESVESQVWNDVSSVNTERTTPRLTVHHSP